ncbi:signal recognition particle-docking protein FtsY [Buchnera aphidicola]|uniref:Signal recognition particle receptor FtsY n=1 Tax=Buchnera aphidicola subsp. Melaphis rhois TaxID=118103 RepID=A0A4D6YFA3_BUCMH|nr:signal recognition particle-docking protein FtsY [Buchnera aphidicola]QCI23075.1 signal recognition particle-docking protein FtsY [Buchnera aphidicola (Melaphis rhois)]
MSKNNQDKSKKFFSWLNLKKKNNEDINNVFDNVIKNDENSKDNIVNNTVHFKNNVENKQAITIPPRDLKKKGILSILSEKLFNTKVNFGLKIQNLFFKKKIDDSIFNDVFEQLLVSDVGLETADMLVNTLKKEAYRKSLNNSKDILSLLKKNMINILKKVENPLNIIQRKPFSILLVGVNGVGKTSMIGKLTHIFKSQGKSVMLAAGDTFRAAAIDQLKILGKNNLVPVVSQQCGSDSASVIFNALQASRSKNIDVLIADTAGRLHNKINLMEELKKIKRVMNKLDCSAPNEIMLVLDSCIGQNSIKQADVFNQTLGITGLVITKLDGTAKGGAIFSIARKLSIPIRYISFGENISDMHVFNSECFVNAIFSKNI